MAVLRLAGLATVAMVLGAAAGTLTVNGMNSASAFTPPEAGTESAALAQIAAETAPIDPVTETESAGLPCTDCSDRTGYVHVAESLPRVEPIRRAISRPSNVHDDEDYFKDEPVDDYAMDHDEDGSTYESDDNPVT